MAGVVPSSPDALLKRGQTAEALTAAGFPVAEATLATKAVRGGGPPYCLFSGRALYRWGDALDWAESLMSPPQRSTSEADARRAGARPDPIETRLRCVLTPQR
jgi:hypothetical protein